MLGLETLEPGRSGLCPAARVGSIVQAEWTRVPRQGPGGSPRDEESRAAQWTRAAGRLPVERAAAETACKSEAMGDWDRAD